MELFLFWLLVMSSLALTLVAQSPSLAPTLTPTSQSPSLSPTTYPSLSPHSVGIITTIVGTGTAGYSGDGGDATSATLRTPRGVALDSSGNVYIGDTGNAVVRKLTIATGKIATIAGTGISGSSGDGGDATSAKLNAPSGVAVDTLGNVYIGDQGVGGQSYSGDGGQASSADTDNCRIRMVDLSTGIITTVAGTGTATSTGDGGDATAATIKWPHQLAVHQTTRDVYICDYGNSKIRKITYSTGLMSTVYSGLSYPYGCTVDNNGNVTAGNSHAKNIKKYFVSSGAVVTVAGTGAEASTGDGGPATSAAINTPLHVATDSSGNIYTAEYAGNKIRKIVVYTTERPTGQPSRQPSSQPTRQPSRQPTSQPTARPSMPTGQPSRQPTTKPTGQPSTQPSMQPTSRPSTQPSSHPTKMPSSQPSARPTQPSSKPTSKPTAQPSNKPSIQPTSKPSSKPSSQPSELPSSQPSSSPTSRPSTQPTSKPSCQPTGDPTSIPSGQPSRNPSNQPTTQPTSAPTCQPTSEPSRQPSGQPSSNPTCPSTHPTSQPSNQPSIQPTSQPSTSFMEVVVFSATMTYMNLDLRDWNADQLHHEALVKASLIQHVVGLHEDDIVDISAVDRSTRRLTTINDSFEVPAECDVYTAYIKTYYQECLSIQDHRRLIVKRLGLEITFNIRPQYFNSTNAVSMPEVYKAVTSRIDTSLTDILLDLQASAYISTASVVGISYSTFSSIALRTSYPTSSPTSHPTCGTGSYQIGDGCGPCTEGYYADSLHAFQCTACPVNTYSSAVGSAECAPCGAFTTNIKEASSSCPHFTLNASAFTYLTLGSFITVLFLFSLLFAGENVYIMFVLGLFPFLDIVSDLVYILSVKFWSFELFFCAILFFIVPSSMFAYKLVCMKAYPRLIRYVGLEIMNDQHIWLSVSSDGLPLINGERSSLSYEEHDGIEKVIWYWLLWILLVTSQVIFVVLSFIWYMVAIAFAAIWLLVGLFLYQTKMLAIGKVWNIWFVAWTRCNDFSKDANLDASLLNESLFHEFIMETIPQIAIQSIDNSLIYNGHFPAISLFSLAMSVFIAINGIYRYGYYLIWKGLKFDEIPLPLAVRMQKINNMSILPRKSMITRKFASFVNSVKISDSSMALKATPGNLKRMSQVMLASNATPHEVVASIMFNIEIGIAKLQSLSTVDSKDFAECNHKFDELVFALRNIMRQSKNIALGNNDSASNSTDECDKIVNKVVAIDIDNTMIRHTYGSYSTRVVPVIETVFEPEFNNPNKFIRNFNDNNNQSNFALEEVRPAVLAVDETCNNVTNVCVDVINTSVFNDLDELSDSIAEENVDDFYDLSDDDIA